MPLPHPIMWHYPPEWLQKIEMQKWTYYVCCLADVCYFTYICSPKQHYE